MRTSDLRLLLDVLWTLFMCALIWFLLSPFSSVAAGGVMACAIVWTALDPIRARKPPLYRWEWEYVTGKGRAGRSGSAADDAADSADPNDYDDRDGYDDADDADDGSGSGPEPGTGDDKFSGSGFFIDERGTLITNYHVIESPGGTISDSIWMEHRGRDYPLRVVASDPERDLAMCRTEAKRTEPCVFRDDGVVRLGEKCFAAGFPREQDFTITDGMISKLSGENSKDGVLQTSAPVHPGSSGGPLIDRFGCVVGAIFGSLDKVAVYGRTNHIPENVNFAVSLDEILNFLDEQNADYLVSDEKEELTPEDIARHAMRYTVSIYVSE